MPSEQPGLTIDVAPGSDEEPTSRTPKVRDPAPPEVPAPRAGKAARPPKPPKPPKPAKRQPVVARRVRRIVRRVDPWSVLKVSLVFFVCGYIVTIVAGIILWNLAVRADMVDKIEDFVEELGAYRSFEFLPDVILQRALLIGGILTVVLTGVAVLASVLFNLISDLVGGIRIVVIEEESARPAASRPDSVRSS